MYMIRTTGQVKASTLKPCLSH